MDSIQGRGGGGGGEVVNSQGVDSEGEEGEFTIFGLDCSYHIHTAHNTNIYM